MGNVSRKSLETVKTIPKDSTSHDAFGRLRVSNAVTDFSSKLLGLDDAPLLWDEQQESGSGQSATTPTAAKPYIDLVSTNVTAGVFTRQTFRRFHYQPGKSQLILMTGVLELASGVKTGCERRIGYFDDDNGCFFESDAGTIGVTTRSNDTATPVDTTVAQADWNIDIMDGSQGPRNPSAQTADWTKAQIFIIDFQWLSVGRVRFGIEIGGIICYVHQFKTANVLATPWSSTPNLPLRYQLITTTGSGICSMRVICSTVITEGGEDPGGVLTRISTGGAAVTTDAENILFALVGIRLKATHVGTHVDLLDAAVQTQTSNEFLEWVIVFNPTVAGTFTYSNVTNSSLQRALGATANRVTGGHELEGGYLGSGNKGGGSGHAELGQALHLGVAIDGTTLDTIVLAVRPIGGVSAADVEGSMTLRESL